MPQPEYEQYTDDMYNPPPDSSPNEIFQHIITSIKNDLVSI